MLNLKSMKCLDRKSSPRTELKNPQILTLSRYVEFMLIDIQSKTKARPITA